jgi:hypothetical protein
MVTERGSIRGEKEVEENSPFAYDSVETENKNKEVLECQLVILGRNTNCCRK